MRRSRRAAAFVAVCLVQAACSEPTQPSPPAATEAARVTSGAGVERLINMMDACDPASFNAALGPGTCIGRGGGVTFDNFLAQLGAHQKVGAWHFAPPNTNVRVGQTLVAINRGGEDHTFTEVEEFGGGFIPVLNQLSGTPVPAPECLALAPGDIVPPGGTVREAVSEAGTEHYQCCIHPWMRTTVNARD